MLTGETTATPAASPDSVSAGSALEGSAPTDPESAGSDTTKESGQLDTWEAQASGQSLGQTPATISSANNIEQMYNTCVELEGTIVAAQSELRALLANRANAEAMRSQAHEAMEQADAAWQEAGLLGEAAWRAFERGFSVDTPEFVNRLRVIREVDEARKAQDELQRVNNLEAWKEADRARQNATTDILKALTALAVAAAQVSRELREINCLSESAISLGNSALDDLRCAHIIGEELAILGQEALGQLGAGKLAGQAQIQERLVNRATARQSSAQPPTGDATPLPDFSDRPPPSSEPEPAPHNIPPAPEPRPAISNIPAAAASPEPDPEPAREDPPAPSAAGIPDTPTPRSPVPSPQELISAAEQFRKEFEATTSAPPENAGSTVISGTSGRVIEAEPSPGAAPAAPLSAAEELQREMASMRPTTIDAVPANTADAVPAHTAPEPPAASTPGSAEVSDDALAPGSEAVPSIPLPESYSGKIYLMFPSTLDQDQVGSVWEVLDDIMGSGAIVDSRLVSREEGVQFTLELGSKTLTLGAIKKKMPGAEMTALKEDRLKINWPQVR